jgi:hypothetical protein
MRAADPGIDRGLVGYDLPRFERGDTGLSDFRIMHELIPCAAFAAEEAKSVTEFPKFADTYWHFKETLLIDCQKNRPAHLPEREDAPA